jgi:hypothetical protein
VEGTVGVVVGFGVGKTGTGGLVDDCDACSDVVLGVGVIDDVRVVDGCSNFDVVLVISCAGVALTIVGEGLTIEPS